MDGTTGYDVLALLDRVLTDPAGEQPLDRPRHTGCAAADLDWQQLVHDRKRAVADGSLLAETRRIVRELPDLLPHHPRAARGRRGRGAGLLPGLPLLPARRSRAPRPGAGRCPAQARPDLAAVLDDLGWVLADPEAPAALRFQQTSGMVMAKGVEDYAFYRTSRLTSLNEVGADPDVFAISPERVPRRDGRPPARLAARDDGAVDPRHQALRGRARPHRRAGRGSRRVGADDHRAPAARADAGRRAGQPAVAGGGRRLADLAASGSMPTPRRRCARPASTPPGPTRRGLRGRPCTRPSMPA